MERIAWIVFRAALTGMSPAKVQSIRIAPKLGGNLAKPSLLLIDNQKSETCRFVSANKMYLNLHAVFLRAELVRLLIGTASKEILGQLRASLRGMSI